LKTKGARETGDSPWSWIILRFLSYLFMHQETSSLEQKSSGTQPAKEMPNVQT
jgi:hypothetical protein